MAAEKEEEKEEKKEEKKVRMPNRTLEDTAPNFILCWQMLAT